ncbi:tRNA lysidine(34) synthetase TilS [Sphingomonas sp. Y38-1Y]|uniref:tRNA lysidine(34) synthetase TilS n=1 Tax=Sphingomonas sp. Y38-1Y TaxID=3078265 RepID=UPI0028EEC5FE|nr:tRNA lysidine(34) synthetase TilS [Sphingomonas sp. Y38-1Y]
MIDVERDTLLVAVSGGGDSLALMLLAQALLGKRCVAATVDHGLRPEAAGEAAFVAGIAAERGIAHATLTGELPARAGRTANVSARARALRYALLEAERARVGAAAIATAHHADDQVETMVMRLNRGSGLAGLAGIRARTGHIVRPLLGWRRAELAAVVAALGIAPVADPSNTDDRFDRARLRKELAVMPSLDPGGWQASAKALGDVEEALAFAAERLIAEQVTTEAGGVRLAARDLPFELGRRLVLLCLQRIDPAIEPRGGEVAAMVSSLSGGRPATLGDVLVRVGRDGSWVFSKAPPRRSS